MILGIHPKVMERISIQSQPLQTSKKRKRCNIGNLLSNNFTSLVQESHQKKTFGHEHGCGIGILSEPSLKVDNESEYTNKQKGTIQNLSSIWGVSLYHPHSTCQPTIDASKILSHGIPHISPSKIRDIIFHGCSSSCSNKNRGVSTIWAIYYKSFT